MSIARRLALVSCLFAVAASASSPEPTREELVAELKKQIAGREQEPAETVFKDVQVFKGRTAEQLLAVMDLGFSRSLGVGCGHCHDVADWPADAKPQKKVAREMSLMTRELNGKLRAIEDLESDTPTVNCTTCHRGQKKPALNLE
ncbi:MAG: c-type cytochrome [Gammaproteobacteria bacterium]